MPSPNELKRLNRAVVLPDNTKPPEPFTEGPIHTNKEGASQSCILGAWHLLDSEMLVRDETIPDGPGKHLAASLLALRSGTVELSTVVDSFNMLKSEAIITSVLERGVKKYGEDNWYGIPTNDHINHAIRHFYRHVRLGLEEDWANFMCRVYMALATALRPEHRGRFTPHSYEILQGVQQAAEGNIKKGL